jgi:hypothetical protein
MEKDTGNGRLGAFKWYIPRFSGADDHGRWRDV